MREIIFRGKSLNNTYSINKGEPNVKIGDWVYGAVIPFDDGIDLIYERDPNNPQICGCHGIDVDHNTVGQYTGFTDGNGKMIFEGDLLDAVVFDCFDNDKRYKLEVQWLGTGFYAVNTDNEDNVWELDWLLYQDEEAEVIGNIHDNNFKS